MKTRMFLFATTLMMMAAGAGFGSCAQSDGVLNPENGQQTAVKAKGHVKLSISPTPSVSSSTMQSRKASSSPALTVQPSPQKARRLLITLFSTMTRRREPCCRCSTRRAMPRTLPSRI